MHLAAHVITCLASDTHHLLSSDFPETLVMLPGCGRKLSCLGHTRLLAAVTQGGNFQTGKVLCPFVIH